MLSVEDVHINKIIKKVMQISHQKLSTWLNLF